jgi:hypothetical protein
MGATMPDICGNVFFGRDEFPSLVIERRVINAMNHVGLLEAINLRVGTNLAPYEIADVRYERLPLFAEACERLVRELECDDGTVFESRTTAAVAGGMGELGTSYAKIYSASSVEICTVLKQLAQLACKGAKESESLLIDL